MSSSLLSSIPAPPSAPTEPYIPGVPKETFQVGDTFRDMATARIHVYTAILDAHQSWKCHKSDPKRTILVCRGIGSCDFRVRISFKNDPKGNTFAEITKYTPHTCHPSTHYDFPEASATWYLSRHLRGIVGANRSIKPRDMEGIKKAYFQHDGVVYKQFWRELRRPTSSTME